MEKPLGIYVHVPFCAKKCPYCDFYSLPYRRPSVEEYLAAVRADMLRRAGQGLRADTLYFGGGTPSLLSPEQIGGLLETARHVFSLTGEITLEANPNTVTARRLADYRANGINRISFGVQSAIPGELAALGRAHTPAQAAEAVRIAEAAGITNLSADLMLGIPYQTAATARASVDFLAALPLAHVSAYLLKPEEATPYWGSPLLAHCADEDETAGLYLETAAALVERGFRQYEISNFARPGWESAHNLKYWRCEEYLGFGPAAHSYFAGRRFCNPPSLSAYCADGGRNPEPAGENAGSLGERIMLGLRLTEGISLEPLQKLPQKADFLRLAGRLAQGGLAQLSENRLSLTPRGFLVSNEILAELLQFVTF